MNYYWLLFFDIKQARRPAVLRQLLANRQKSSALYFGLISGWLKYINLFNGLDEAKFDREIAALLQAGYLKEQRGGLVLTSAGQEVIEKHKLTLGLQKPELFRVFSMQLVSELILLAIQVASEASYQNKRYYVVTSNLQSQYLFKSWLAQNSLTILKDKLPFKLAAFLANEDPLQSEIFTQKLVGHKLPGKTNEQLGQIYGKRPAEIELIWLDLLSRLAYFLLQGKDELAQLIMTTKPVFEPVRASRFLTINAFNAGQDIKTIAQNLRLKENTILDHLYEGYIWHGQPDLLQLLSQDEIAFLKATASKAGPQETWAYQELVAKRPQLAFYKFRIFEIARGRKLWEN